MLYESKIKLKENRVRKNSQLVDKYRKITIIEHTYLTFNNLTIKNMQIIILNYTKDFLVI